MVAPGGSLKTKEKIKQIPDNQILSGISFFPLTGSRKQPFQWLTKLHIF